jgi:hypothetical protein
MPERSFGRLSMAPAPVPQAGTPDPLDETVIHDPSGRPWLVCTSDLLSRPEHLDHLGRLHRADAADSPPPDEAPPPAACYETQVYYTARAGIRGFPTGHGQCYVNRDDAVAGHRRWCRGVREGHVIPDQVPDEPL